MHGRARIVWNHCAGFDSGILLCSVDMKQASADPPESGTGNCAGVGIQDGRRGAQDSCGTGVVGTWNFGSHHCPSGNAYIFDSLGDQERKKRNQGRAGRKARVKRGTKKGVCRMSGLPFFRG